MRGIVCFSLAALALPGLPACNEEPASHNTASVAAAPADNTKKNERDRNPTVTPMDQGENEVDRTITQQIRQAVMKRDSFSTNAKNVKIITLNGVVTLRGPVQSAQEKTDIEALAKATAGVQRVDNALEIASN